jgi:phospholipid transport system substrate-binding protein
MRSLIAMFAVALAFFSSADASIPHAQESNRAEAFVQNSIDKGLSILNETTLSANERENRFRALLLTVIDFKRISIFTLGRYARGVPEADIQSFARALANFVTAILHRNLQVDGITVRVTGSTTRAADDVIVSADVVRPTTGDRRLSISFRVRKTEQGHDAIVDVAVERIWLALTQRDEFSAYLHEHNGSILQLASELESRAVRIRGVAPRRR